MGVGNYTITNGKTVQVDHQQLYGDYNTEDGFEWIEGEWDYQFRFNDFISEVLELIPSSYEVVDEYDHGESSKIIAENNLYTIQIKDWDGYVALSLAIKEDDRYDAGVHPFAQYHLEKRAAILFDKLATCFDLRIPCGPWTSGSYEVSKVA